MIRYPAFNAAVAERDLGELAACSGVPIDVIGALLTGEWVAALPDREPLASALGADPIELFRLEPALEQALAAAPSRYVTDPAVLRLVDRR